MKIGDTVTAENVHKVRACTERGSGVAFRRQEHSGLFTTLSGGEYDEGYLLDGRGPLSIDEFFPDTPPMFTKHDAGKNRLGLLPPHATEAVGRVLTFGAKKYSPDNWRNVDDRTRYVDAALRHVFAYQRGKRVDPESGEHALAHAVCCLMFLVELDAEAGTPADTGPVTLGIGKADAEKPYPPAGSDDSGGEGAAEPVKLPCPACRGAGCFADKAPCIMCRGTGVTS